MQALITFVSHKRDEDEDDDETQLDRRVTDGPFVDLESAGFYRLAKTNTKNTAQMFNLVLEELQKGNINAGVNQVSSHHIIEFRALPCTLRWKISTGYAR